IGFIAMKPMAGGNLDDGTLGVTVLDNTLKTLTVDGENVLSSLEAHVASADAYVAIVAEAQSDDYKVTITPAAEASGDNAGKYAVAAAGTTFTVKVEEKVAEGGTALGLASKTYTLKVYRDYDIAKLNKLDTFAPNSSKKVTGSIDIGYGWITRSTPSFHII
ncbi:MAG: hypothetical protein IIX71_05925, partial [Ruminococcus sp.]|nr:hypothetical protein [Ruminococcus sp.]